jgi:hypothetical protein
MNIPLFDVSASFCFLYCRHTTSWVPSAAFVHNSIPAMTLVVIVKCSILLVLAFFSNIFLQLTDSLYDFSAFTGHENLEFYM